MFVLSSKNVQFVTRVKNGHFEHVFFVLMILGKNGDIGALGDNLKLFTSYRVLFLALVIYIVVT